MAKSPSHKFGQIIGDVLEQAIAPQLRDFVAKHGLFLDTKGDRKPARTGKKVSWKDKFGNFHDLDFVIEKGGAAAQIGKPVAFIESAWRRYTKHSRNKVQEILGAVLPLCAEHEGCCPFVGVVLAGDYTEGALQQLTSNGCTVLHFPYSTVIEAFAYVEIDANFDEHTPDHDFQNKVDAWNNLEPVRKTRVPIELVRLNQLQLDNFMTQLTRKIERTITAICITPLHGTSIECVNVNEAAASIEQYDGAHTGGPLKKFEVRINYDNGDRIEAQFQEKTDALQFIKGYADAILDQTS